MLRFLGSSQGFCDGVSRRNFMQIGTFGAGLTLADMLRGQAAHAATAAAKKQASRSQKAAIMIYLPGGPTHLDMYDPKPNAPVEIRGETKTISTNVNGVQITDLFPLQAKMWDKLAVVRSLIGSNEHSDSTVMTGYSDLLNRVANHPSFGSVVSKVRSAEESAVPPFVSLRGMSRGSEPGFLGIAHRPFAPSGQGNANLKLANGVTSTRLDERKGLLDTFDDTRRDIDATGAMTGLDAYTEKAIEMVTSGTIRKALDNSHEPAANRERYKGVEQFLTARRLIEAGVGCVTLSFGGWDSHGNNFSTMKKQLPMVDKAISSLIQDLHDRGMQDDVVTVMWGEFGRTPKINMGAGRDHWPAAMSALVAGGGLKMGQAVGSTTSNGERPKDSPYTIQQVLATLYSAIGIDPAQTFQNGSGRPMYLLDNRDPVAELIG